MTKARITSAVLAWAMVAVAAGQWPRASAAADAAATAPAARDAYQARFAEMWAKLNDKANGYFSPQGVPYHSVETLMCEAPDYGHETSSETLSYYVWLAAMHGRFTGDWSAFAKAWDVIDKYAIGSDAVQVGLDRYNAAKPAAYAPEFETPDKYPAPMDPGLPVGADPLHEPLHKAYNSYRVYGMHWLIDTDNWYGFGGGQTGPVFINTFQRGPEESTWETVPHPSIEQFQFGGRNGFLDLFVKDNNYARQWRFTDAPDADARAIQATYWAWVWRCSETDAGPLPDSPVGLGVGRARRMGDYLRYALFDKYFKPVGCQDKSAAGKDYDSCHYLLSWYYAWGGSANKDWSWKIGSSHIHFGYQNPLAAYVMATVPQFKPAAERASQDWKESLNRQVEFYQWLQSAEGGIAGGASNSWNGRYEKYPAGTPTFHGLGYQENPVYVDPGSNAWFGFQCWSMQRMAEYYYLSGDERTGKLLAKWFGWVKSAVKLNADGTFSVPSKLKWTGKPETWAGTAVENKNLHVVVEDSGADLGVAASLANTLCYYAAGTKKHGTYDDAPRALAKELLDRMWDKYRDDKGLSVAEPRADYKRFFEQEVYIPAGWTGKMPNGDVIKPGVKFLDIRTGYKKDPGFAALETACKAGKVPEFRYHRFWAQCDIAIANGVYSILFGQGK
jgi:hypothetical protein